jgi:hypothetical protein
MKHLLLALVVAICATSCTTVNITISSAPCATCYTEAHHINYEGVEVIVRGTTADNTLFANSHLNKNILLDKGYRMESNDYGITFTHPDFYGR